MVLYEFTGRTESDPSYQLLASRNLIGQYYFLESVILASINSNWKKVSSRLIKSFNHHAIAGLHEFPGQYRPCPVKVGDFLPPEHHRVPTLMDEFVNDLNRWWESANAIALGSYALWKLNHIHPFVNGNGRTARALCYYLICVRTGVLLTGRPILPELIYENRTECISVLKRADAAYLGRSSTYLDEIYEFVKRLIEVQVTANNAE